MRDLDQSLYVGEVEITRDEIRRQVIYGPGRKELELREDLFLVEQHLDLPSLDEGALHLVPDADFQLL